MTTPPVSTPVSPQPQCEQTISVNPPLQTKPITPSSTDKYSLFKALKDGRARTEKLGNSSPTSIAMVAPPLLDAVSAAVAAANTSLTPRKRSFEEDVENVHLQHHQRNVRQQVHHPHQQVVIGESSISKKLNQAMNTPRAKTAVKQECQTPVTPAPLSSSKARFSNYAPASHVSSSFTTPSPAVHSTPPQTPSTDREWPSMPSTEELFERRSGLKLYARILQAKFGERDELTSGELTSTVVEFVKNGKLLNNGAEKNICRRVYDALNILHATGVISRNSNPNEAGIWRGTDLLKNAAVQSQTNAPGVERLESIRGEIKILKERLERKKIEAVSVNQQYVALKWLIDRNLSRLARTPKVQIDTLVHIPFVVISSQRECPIELQVSADGEFVLLEYRGGLRLKDDLKVLQLICKKSTKNFTEITNHLPNKKELDAMAVLVDRDATVGSLMPR
eukprot:TRINITY_DN11579_c0_g5_i2.p1 TRINITY_DN11579_c0_g5~~TRINITY_DN11579_c0_g5_i2.p1  ORF type:complete len:481 (-),score=96.61 TRINITY_DN11579_c0_g5_i2:195-1544(-)